MEKKEFIRNFAPNQENIETIGKSDDYIFQALAYMGMSSHHMSWANTTVEDLTNVSDQIKKEMKSINEQIQALQERLREIQ